MQWLIRELMTDEHYVTVDESWNKSDPRSECRICRSRI